MQTKPLQHIARKKESIAAKCRYINQDLDANTANANHTAIR